MVDARHPSAPAGGQGLQCRARFRFRGSGHTVERAGRYRCLEQSACRDPGDACLPGRPRRAIRSG